MSTVASKMARSAAVAAFISAATLFGASNANALTNINIGNLVNANYNYGNLDLTSDDVFAFEGTVKGTGKIMINTFVGSMYSSANALINTLLNVRPGSTGTVSGSWGSNPITFVLTNGTWSAAASTNFSSTGVGGAQLLTINYSNFNRQGQFSANVSAVPVPGAAFLLLSGLGGLGFLARRRKVAKV